MWGGSVTVKRAIFLDRDGTLNVDVGFTHRVADLELLPGVVPGLAQLRDLGFLLVITTNQSGVARGHFSEADMQAFNDALVARLASEGVAIAAVYSCPFHPTEGQGPYHRDSELRKPQPGMILAAAADHDIELAASFAIGDKATDVLAGRGAGCRTILVRTGLGREQEKLLDAPPDFVADDLVAAAAFIARHTPQTAVGPKPDSTYPAARSAERRTRKPQ